MKTHKKAKIVGVLILATLLFISCLFIPNAMASELPFSDVSVGAWYYEAVEYVYENELFKGYENGNFAPNDEMTRAQLVQALANLVEQMGTDTSGYTQNFIDVSSNHWASPVIAWATQNGIVDGIGDNKFAPEDKVTREQVATLYKRFIVDYLKIDIDNLGLKTFKDSNKISDWAKESVEWVASRGLFNGYEDNTFRPRDNMTRAQVAQAFLNADFYQYIEGTSIPGDFTILVELFYSASENITISWTSANNAVRYDLVIRDIPNGKIVFNESVTGNSKNIGYLPGLALGSYEIYMQAYNSNGEGGEKVGPVRFNVRTDSMTLSVNSSYTTSENIVISWEAANNAVKYSLSVYNGGISGELFTEYTTSNHLNIGKLPVADNSSKKYLVIVRAYSSQDTVIASASTDFIVTEPVQTPGSFTISVNSSYKTSDSITISWTTASSAVKYGLTVRDRSTNKDVFDQYVTGNSKNIGALPVGNYLIYMRGYNSAGTGGVTVGPVYFTVNAVSTYQKAMFIMDTLNVTQVRNTGSHTGDKYNTYAIDLAGKDTGIDYAYAPFDGVVARVEANTTYGNAVWFQSTNKVEYADGTIDYMTLYLVHINTSTMNELGIKVGKTFKQGERFYAEGTYGNASGNHIHLVALRGQVNTYNGGTVVNQENALYLSQSTTIKNSGGLNWKRLS